MRPKMVLDPEAGTELRFEQVVIGRTRVEPKVVTVRNIGDGVLSLEDVHIEGAAASSFVLSSAPRQVLPGASGEIWVRFEPTTKLEAAASLVLSSNDPERRQAAWPLVGSAREPCAIELTPPHSSFLLGEIKSLRLQNTSSEDCRITHLTTDAILFPFHEPPELPLTVAAGQGVDLRILHRQLPSEPGVPIRGVIVREAEGTEATASISGEPPVFGCLDVSPLRIQFPQTVAGQSVSDYVTVENRCSREAFVSSALVITGVGIFSAEANTLPAPVPPMGRIDLEISYTAFEQFGDQGRVLILTNDAGAPRFEVELFGTAAVPGIEYFPTNIDLGTVVFQNPQGPNMRSECSSRTQYVQIYSTGEAALEVTRLEIDAAGDPDFVVTGVLVDGSPVNFAQPFRIPPGREAKVSLQFYPSRSSPEEHHSTLLIHHNAGPQPGAVSLVGNATLGGNTTDVFTQLEGPQVDIVWVIDDSCSMVQEQAALINNLSTFVGYASTQNADWQMAVINTDGHSRVSGRFRSCFPFPRIITHDYADQQTREEAFRCLFDVGTRGSGVEAGIAAAKNAVERALSADTDPVSNPNTGFIREDSKLAVVIVSDEDDQSNESLDLMRDYFFSVHGFDRKDRVAIHAIAGPVAEPCASGPTTAQPGYNYFWMTEQTTGLFQNICDRDWSPILQALGLNVFTPLNRWVLSRSADPNSLMVEVNGMPVPRDPNNGFSFDSSANSVVFNGTSVPPASATISINYSSLCRP